MDDLVKRSEVQKTLEWCRIWGDARIRGVVNSIPSAQSWTPCSEELPKESGVFIVSGGNDIWFARFTRIGETQGWENPANFPPVMAWMPRPEPYRKEDSI